MKKQFDIKDFPEWDATKISSVEQLENLVKHLKAKLIKMKYDLGRTDDEFIGFSLDVIEKLTKRMLKQKGFDPEIHYDEKGSPFFKKDMSQ